LRFCSLQCLRSQGLCFTLSALALSHRFSGFCSLWPFEFISPRSAPGLLLQSFLLREIGCFFFPDFVGFRSSVRLISLAATRSCYRVNCLNPVLRTTLQFDFRGFFPLAARSVGSMVNRLQWSMLSWFSLLFRGSFSLSCAPYLDLDRCNTSVTAPTLTVYNKLASSSAFASASRSPLLVGSTVRFLASPLLLYALRLLPFNRQPSHLVHRISTSAISSGCFPPASASCLASLRTYRLSYSSRQVAPSLEPDLFWVAPASITTKQFQPSLTLALRFI